MHITLKDNKPKYHLLKTHTGTNFSCSDIRKV